MSHADVSQELGRIAAAHRDLRAAAVLVSRTRSAELDIHRAVLLQNIGQLAEAQAIYHRILSDPRADPRRAVVCANNLALIESQQGRYDQALRLLAQALSAAAEIGPALAAPPALSRAWVTVQSGRFTEGLALFDDAAQAYRAAGLPLGEHYIEYADALIGLRLLPEAAAAARLAVTEFSAAGVSLMVAEAQLRVARLALLEGDTAEAITASVAAAATFRRQTRPAWRARALLVTAEARLTSGIATPADLSAAHAASRTLAALGIAADAVDGLLVTGRLAAALGRRRQAIAVLTRAGSLARGAPVLVRLRGQVSSAIAASLRHDDRAVLAHCRSGLGDLARHRRSLPSVELRALASGHGAELGLMGLDVVVRTGSPTRVLHWMERSRAAALLAVEPPEFDEIRADLDGPARGSCRGQGGRCAGCPARWPGPCARSADRRRAGCHREPDSAGHLAGEFPYRCPGRAGYRRCAARSASRPGAGRVRPGRRGPDRCGDRTEGQQDCRARPDRAGPGATTRVPVRAAPARPASAARRGCRRSCQC